MFPRKAPEVISMEPYGHAADWWSLGVIAFCLITGEVGAQILLHYIIYNL